MCIEEKLQALEQKVQAGELNYDDFERFHSELSDKQNEFQNLIEYAWQLKRNEKKFGILYTRIAGKNCSEIIERLTRLGYALKKDLGEPFSNAGYRLLEQTRAGKRDDVYYGILRIFVANNRKFPDDLVEAFKPIYSEEMFKVFIFSFLSGIIGKEQQAENQ